MGQMVRLSRATKCKYCGAEICFIKTVAGKSMPVDPDPVTFWPDYLAEKFVMIDGNVMSGKRVQEDETQHTQYIGYISHFSTCPKAADARQHKNKSERKREYEQTHLDD